MKAITLHRPWAWAIAHAGKDVENRSWFPPESLIGQRIAIHAGKRWDEDGAEFVFDVLADIPRYSHLELPPESQHPLGIVAVATLASADSFDWRKMNGDPWAFGPVCWRLADVQALPTPIFYKGAQGLWEVPREVLAAMQEQGIRLTNS